MARVKCRCGETLTVTGPESDRVTCPRCGAKIRVRRSPAASPAVPASDGFLRFPCPCGRRLKVRAAGKPEAGKCPDCGRIVPVPASAWPSAIPAAVPGDQGQPRSQGAGARTEDLDAADLERLERWARSHGASPQQRPATGEDLTTSHPGMSPVPAGEGAPAVVKMEAGLRVCPRCHKPVHMSATVCRACGEPVPKR